MFQRNMPDTKRGCHSLESVGAIDSVLELGTAIDAAWE